MPPLVGSDAAGGVGDGTVDPGLAGGAGPGVDVGDVIVLPGTEDPVLVSRVRLGQGSLIFTVAPASNDSFGEEEQPVKLTAMVHLRKRGRDMAS